MKKLLPTAISILYAKTGLHEQNTSHITLFLYYNLYYNLYDIANSLANFTGNQRIIHGVQMDSVNIAD